MQPLTFRAASVSFPQLIFRFIPVKKAAISFSETLEIYALAEVNIGILLLFQFRNMS